MISLHLSLVVRRQRRRRERSAIPDKDRMWGPKMLAMIPWAGRFFSGPKDPVAHPFAAHCRICQTDVSVKSKGHYDIVRHWVRDKHFRREQKYRDEHGLEVLNRQRQVLLGHRLEVERREFETIPLVELGPWYPYHDEQLEEVASALEVAEKQTKLQLEVGVLPLSFCVTSVLPLCAGAEGSYTASLTQVLFLEKVVGKLSYI